MVEARLRQQEMGAATRAGEGVAVVANLDPDEVESVADLLELDRVGD